MLVTTLAKLRNADPSTYNKLVRQLQGEFFLHAGEVQLEFILNTLGLDVALWALRASNCSARDARLLAVTFAREVRHLMPEASRAALDVAERFANGLATPRELAEARSAAYAASGASTAAYAACATATAAATATYAVAASSYAAGVSLAAARGCSLQRQEDLFRQLCQGTAPWQVDSAP